MAYYDFQGFPPTLMTFDDTELLADAANVVFNKMRKANVEVKAHITSGLLHNVFWFHDIMPEAHTWIEESANFVKELKRN